MTNSYYDLAPGENGTLETFDLEMMKLIDATRSLGLASLKFGIDEGRILWGPEGKQLGLLSRAVGNTYEASFDALWFAKSVQLKLNWYNRWAVNVAGTNDSPLDAVSTHIAKFGFQMANDALIEVNLTVSEPLSDASDSVQALAGANDSHIHLMMLNHNPQLVSAASEKIVVSICGLSTIGVANATYWIVDDDHGQFWNTWWADKIAHNISSFPSGWSSYSEVVDLTDPKEIGYWESRLPFYQQLATLQPSAAQYSVSSSGCIEVDAILGPHAVHFVEIAAVM